MMYIAHHLSDTHAQSPRSFTCLICFQNARIWSQFGSKGIDGIDGIDSVQGAADVPSEEVEVGVAYGDRAAKVAGTRIPKIGVDSRDIKLHFLHHQRDMATRYDRWHTTLAPLPL